MSQEMSATEAEVPTEHYDENRLLLEALYRKARRYVGHILMLIGVFIILFPLYWMATISFRPTDLLFIQDQPLINPTWSLEGYKKVFNPVLSNAMTYFKNSIIVTAGVVTVNTTLATLGGWGLTRLDIPYKKSFARLILFGYMFPPILLAIPMFIFWQQFGLTNTYVGLIFALVAGSLPFSLWLMWKFFQTVPYSQEEAAYMAGATRFRAFYEIALPQAKPGIIAIAIFSYAIGWSAYTLPKIINSQESMWVMTVGLETFLSGYTVEWPVMMAAATIYVLPVFFFVFFLQKYLLAGFRTAR